MGKADFKSYGGKQDFLPCEQGKVASFVETSGGPVDPFGDWEKKGKSDLDMNAAQAFNEKDMTKVDAMGTDTPKKGTSGQRSDNSGDHFSVGSVTPMGDDAGKKASGQTSKRG